MSIAARLFPLRQCGLGEDVEGYRNGDNEESEDHGLIYRLSEVSVLQAIPHAGLHRGTSVMIKNLQSRTGLDGSRLAASRDIALQGTGIFSLTA
jgi:hypothetical protein